MLLCTPMAGLARTTILLVAMLAGRHAAAQCESQQLTGTDPVTSDSFGDALAADGDVAIAGARHDSESAFFAGAAYVIRHDGAAWNVEEKLVGAQLDDHDNFGRAVAVDGALAVISAPGDDDVAPGGGAAYVYRFDGASWPLEAKLTAADGAELDGLGLALAVSGDTVLAGATYADGAESTTGAAYVFRYDGKTWGQEQKLVASDGAQSDLFGGSVAIDGDVALVGAPGDDPAGSVYVFRFDGASWQEDSVKLTALDGIAGDGFGRAIALDGDVAAISSVRSTVDGAAGAVYVFRADGDGVWTQEAKLYPSDGLGDDDFGVSVALDGPVLVGGASSRTFGAVQTGSAYVYRHDGAAWSLEAELLTSDGAHLDRAGDAVAVTGERVLVGAPLQDPQGAVYAYGATLDGVDCNDNRIDDACEIARGISSDCDEDGVPDGCAPCPADLVCTGVVDFADLLALLANWGPCVAREPTREQEPCGADTNGGCNLDPPVFEPIACGGTIAGTAWYDPGAGVRDTDWFVLTIAEPSVMTFEATLEFDGGIGLWRESGSPSCGGIPEAAFFVFGPAGQTLSFTTNEDPPGEYWYFVLPAFSDAVVCGLGGDGYLATITCDPSCRQDLDGDGVVGFQDLILLLAAWGPCA